MNDRMGFSRSRSKRNDKKVSFYAANLAGMNDRRVSGFLRFVRQKCQAYLQPGMHAAVLEYCFVVLLLRNSTVRRFGAQDDKACTRIATE